MLETLIVLLVVLWLLGAVVAPVGFHLDVGGGHALHLLLVVALVLLILRLLQGRPLR